MCLLLNLENDITLNHICPLLALSLEPDCICVLHTRFHNYEEIFRFIYQSLTLTRGTLFRKNFTLAWASRAWLLHLHLHHSHIHFLSYLSWAFTSGACFEVATFRTWSFAFATVDISIDWKLLRVSTIQLLQCGFNSDFHLWSLLSSVATPIYRFRDLTRLTVRIVLLLRCLVNHKVVFLSHLKVLRRHVLFRRIYLQPPHRLTQSIIS